MLLKWNLMKCQNVLHALKTESALTSSVGFSVLRNRKKTRLIYCTSFRSTVSPVDSGFTLFALCKLRPENNGNWKLIKHTLLNERIHFRNEWPLMHDNKNIVLIEAQERRQITYHKYYPVESTVMSKGPKVKTLVCIYSWEKVTTVYYTLCW